MKRCLISSLLLFATAVIDMSAEDFKPTLPELEGTIRGKFEYQTTEGQGRFMVRNARVSISGRLLPSVDYKAEIDLCDEGQIRMLDAFGRVQFGEHLDLTLGQMRVPFTIDAHRSPHLQFFANRSFIAKQVGSVRDVGARLTWKFGKDVPVVIQAGLFNGSGITGQKDFWTGKVNYSAKVAVQFLEHFNIVLSTQKVSPADIDVFMYSAGAYCDSGRLHIEAEYVYKTYEAGAFADVHSYDIFAGYRFRMPGDSRAVESIMPLVRFDSMTDNSDALRYFEGAESSEGSLIVTDYGRSRLTAGFTLSLGTPFVADVRVNYEKYFYRSGAVPAVSEKDKFVIELMVHF